MRNMNKKTSQLLLALALAAMPAAAIADAGAAKANTGATEIDYIGRNWYERINLSGFGAVGYTRTSDTKDAAAEPNGSFEVNQVNLFIEADLSDDISFFYELEAVGLAQSAKDTNRSNETYVKINNAMGEETFNLKVGRFDYNFGEEYLIQDANTNPFVDFTVAWPHGRSEGVELSGNYSDVGWVVGLTNGNASRSQDSNVNKTVNAKLYGNITDDLYVSGSFMTGNAGVHAFEFSGTNPSVVAGSPSASVDSTTYQVDVKWNFDGKSNIAAYYGMSEIDDNANAFDRDLNYWAITPQYFIADDLYVAFRYSAIGTWENDEGYSFAANNYSNGNAYGYTLESVERYQLGLGYYIEPNVLAKLEYHHDDFEQIDGANAGLDDTRAFYGAMVVVTF
jgi:hypothetical protein